jgi:spore maturation protein CgeB
LSSKPKIVFICDVPEWAWHIKSKQIKKYLSDDFDIDIVCTHANEEINMSKYDVYFTYGYSFIKRLVKAGVPYKKRITGLTAHRDKHILEPRMKEAYATHANSMMLLDYLKTMHSNTYYLPNGVDEEMFKPIISIPEHRDNIIVGHIAKENVLKGHRDFVIPAIRKSKADHFYHHATHREKVPHNDMVAMYQKFDCFIVASIEDGTPNPALEAAACGRPIISNRIGNMPEFIRNGYNGFIMDERNIDEYVRRINWFREHRNEMIEMGKNARKTIEEGWTWRIQSENYRKMLWDVVKA